MRAGVTNGLPVIPPLLLLPLLCGMINPGPGALCRSTLADLLNPNGDLLMARLVGPIDSIGPDILMELEPWEEKEFR